MQIVENFGTQTSSKSENAKVILSNPAEILAVFPELSSKFDKIPMEYDYRTCQHVELIDQVIIKKCDPIEHSGLMSMIFCQFIGYIRSGCRN